MPRVKIQKLHPKARIPAYQSSGASGFDLHALEALQIAPSAVALVRTGLAVSLEQGFELQIRSRSGLALRDQIVVLNSPGTIDSDYRGELQVILMNLSRRVFSIQPGDRIAQAILCQVFSAQFELVTQLETSARGCKGFGSSGI
ncbi:dUTP diphosphatase [Helicobacter vulpis]|uniref:dUTP diphosphatase n=1 Tax=Helicobacter vulpis TaxID=2316076 RepID=UPI000EB3BCEC|nr:dUTP diphosphatase [Helicobacter vulpis]